MGSTYNIVTNLIIFVPLVVIFAVLPFITRKDIVFGINIPAAQWSNDYFRKLRRVYSLLSAGIGAVLMGASVLASVMLGEDLAVVYMQVIIWSAILIYFLLYVFFWIKVKKYKAQASWKISEKRISAADTNVSGGRRALSNAWYLVYPLLIGVTLYSAVKLYGLAPNMIPMRFDLQGNPIVYSQKSMKLIYEVVGMQAFLALLFFGINIVLKMAKKSVDPADPEASSVQSDAFRYRWSIFLFITGLLMLLIFTVVMVSIFVRLPMWAMLYVPMAASAAILVYAVVLAIMTGQSGSRIKIEGKRAESTEIIRDDDAFWKLGMFYYNKEDPAVFVERRFSPGWTTNWARWQSWLIVFGILAMVAVSLYFSF
ncbi:MAG: hypothetical protein JXN65_01435 [Clostridia bacterium]|nr:hypothetical protein [Clostridia bacterium]